jgi:hypothetical protein
MKDFRLKPVTDNKQPRERKKSKLFEKSDPTWKKINLTICALLMFIGAVLVYNRDQDIEVMLVFIGIGVVFLIFGFYEKKPKPDEGETDPAVQRIEQKSGQDHPGNRS